MNNARLGLIILTLTCLPWGWVAPCQAQNNFGTQNTPPVAMAARNLPPNQRIISDLKVFLDDQRQNYGLTPQNNSQLRQIQNLVNRYQSGGNAPPIGNPPPSSPAQCRYLITVNTGTAVLSPNSNLLQGDGPGTDANVTFTIVGHGGLRVPLGPISGAQNGYQRGRYLFEYGSQDSLSIQGVDVGSLRNIEVRRDNNNSSSSDWQIDSITVEKRALNGALLSRKTTPYGQWLLNTRSHIFRLQ